MQAAQTPASAAFEAMVPAPATFWRKDELVDPEPLSPQAAEDLTVRTEERIKAELEQEFRDMLAGKKDFVTKFYCSTREAGTYKERDTWSEIHASLDYYAHVDILREALRDSTCPILGRLRDAMAERFAADQYVEQAQIEMGVL